LVSAQYNLAKTKKEALAFSQRFLSHILVGHVWQQSHEPGPLDGLGQIALGAGLESGPLPGKDAGVRIGLRAELGDVLVVDVIESLLLFSFHKSNVFLV